MRVIPNQAIVVVIVAILAVPAAHAGGPEGAPVGLVAIPTGHSAVALSWSEPLSSGGGALEYRVYRGDGVNPPVMLGTANGTSYLDEVPLNATAPGFLLYQVTAVNAGVESPPSNPAIVPAGSCLVIDGTTTPPTVYFPPDDLSDCIPPIPPV